MRRNLVANAGPWAPARADATSRELSAVSTATALTFGPAASAALAVENDSDVASLYHPVWTVGAPVSARSIRNASADETIPRAAIAEMTCESGSPWVTSK